MKTLMTLTVMAAMAFSLAACSQDTSQAESNEDAVAEGSPCVIMPSKPIEKQFYHDYEGNRYYFCCADCITMFKRNPDLWVKKIQADPKMQDSVEPIP